MLFTSSAIISSRSLFAKGTSIHRAAISSFISVNNNHQRPLAVRRRVLPCVSHHRRCTLHTTSSSSTKLTVISQDDDYGLIEDYSIDDDIIVEGIAHSSSTSTTLLDHQSSEDESNTQPQMSQEEQIAHLRTQLKQYRINQSQPIKKPAYTIFTNAALDGICELLPTTHEELLEVKGIGKKKLELYGDDILGIVQRCVNGVLLDRSEESVAKSRIPKPTPITLQSLTVEQRLAAERVLDPVHPSNVFISGAAGTGKSHVSKYIIQMLLGGIDGDDDDADIDNNNGENDNNDGTALFKTVPIKRKVAAVAPTGVAAINIGGSTLHSFFGIGLGLISTNSISSVMKKVRGNKEAVRRIQETDVLLIDEVSMLSSDLLELLDVVAREIRKVDDVAMGGMQIIAVGDFYQLPPIVSDRGRMNMNYGEDVDGYRPFCFDSPIWDELGLHDNTFELSQVQRQESGSKFEMFLNDMVRVGNVPPSVLRDFNRKCLISEEHPLPDDGIVPTRIYTHNRDVDSENEARLAELEGELTSFKAIDEWREAMPTGTLASIKKSMKASVSAELPDEVELKIGAQVMLTRNKDLDSGADRGLVNGSRGVVQDFHSFDKLPVVRFDNGRVERINRVEAVRYNPDGGPGVLIRKQLPLKLGWATTVHKSQGCTLTRAILDISRTFEAGQAYVSLSRVKDIEGLYLERPVNMDNIQVSRRVLEYYQRVR